MKNNMKNKWKDVFLKTGLPLESEVSRLLEEKDFRNFGQYDYLRENKTGKTTEFSVDLHAAKFLNEGTLEYWASVDLLIECKYVGAVANWVFFPITNPVLVTKGYINVQQHFCPKRINNEQQLRVFDTNLAFCLKGTDLREDSANPEIITRGLCQLRYALPKLYISNARFQLDISSDVDTPIFFPCPILVTNARLFVLNEDVGIDKIKGAKSFNSIAEEKEMLIHYQTLGPELANYISSNVSSFFEKNAEAEKRLTEIEKLRRDTTQGLISFSPASRFNFERDVWSATEHILIVNKGSLDKALDKLIDCVSITKLAR